VSTLEAPQFVVAQAVPESTRAARAIHGCLWVGSLAILIAAALLRVEGGTRVILPLANRTLPELCYWRVMFHMDCPGCGMTRCFISAAHGDLSAAAGYNPIGLLLFIGLIAQIPYRPWQLWRISTGRRELHTIDFPFVMLGISVLLILQWFWRVLL